MFRWLAAKQYQTEVRENIRFLFRDFPPGFAADLERRAFSGRLNKAIRAGFDDRTPATSTAITLVALMLEHAFDLISLQAGQDMLEDYLYSNEPDTAVRRLRSVSEKARMLSTADAERNLIDYTIEGGLRGCRGSQAFNSYRFQRFTDKLLSSADEAPQ